MDASFERLTEIVGQFVREAMREAAPEAANESEASRSAIQDEAA